MNYTTFIQSWPGNTFATTDPTKQGQIEFVLQLAADCNPACVWGEKRERAIALWTAAMLSVPNLFGSTTSSTTAQGGAAPGLVQSLQVGQSGQSVTFANPIELLKTVMSSSQKMNELLALTPYGSMYLTLAGTLPPTSGFIL